MADAASPITPRALVYCLKGAKCGNPYMRGKFYVATGVGTGIFRCPRCSGPWTDSEEEANLDA